LRENLLVKGSGNQESHESIVSSNKTFSEFDLEKSFIEIMVKKQKRRTWEQILGNVYYTPGKSGSFSSARRLRKVLKNEYGRNVKEKKIQDWLESQFVYTLHKNRRKVFPRNKTLAFHIDHNWQADIGFFTKLRQKNKGFSCFLLAIDVVSRFVWVEPMKTKNGVETARSFEAILKRSFPRCPEKLQTDKGTEFFNKHFRTVMKKHKIHLYSTESDQKAAMAERAIKTIKTLIYRYLSSQQSEDWISVIQDLVTTYNGTFHSAIGLKPTEVNYQTQKEVLNKLYGFLWSKDTKPIHSKYHVGDNVRLSEVKRLFRKGYEGGWTKEIFKITKVLNKVPRVMYEVSNFEGNEAIKGSFYDDELSKVNIPKQTFWRVEKVLKKEFRKKVLWYLVKFMNFEKPEWIPASNIADVKDVKKKFK
jgi:hypothetical protein